MAGRPADHPLLLGELIGLIGLALLAACARDAPAPLPDLPVGAVSVAVHGPAEIEAAGGALRLAPNGEGEAGFFLSIGESAAWPDGARAAAITFRLEAETPWNIREGGAGGYAYASTADRQHAIVQRDVDEPALIYTALPGAHRLQIERAEWCADLAACPKALPSGAQSIATGPNGAVIVDAYGPAELSAANGALKLVSSEDSEVGFRINLAGGVRWPKGAQSAAVRFRLESDRPWAVSEIKDGARAYSSTEARDFVRITKAQEESPLIFTRAPGAHRLVVKDIVWCGAGDQRCTAESVAWRRMSGSGDVALYWEPFRGSDAERAGETRLAARSATDGAAYGVRLAPLDVGGERVVIVYEVSGDVPVTLRRRRDGEFAYLDAGRSFVVLKSTDRALLYSETAGAFDVKITEVFPCARSRDWRCRTKEEFLALLPPERGASRAERLRDLLEWATRNADYSQSEVAHSRFSPGNLGAHHIYFKYFENDVAGGYCGGTSVFFARVLQLAGFDAFTFDFGELAGDLTHVTTIVANEDKFYLYDATFGMYLADPESLEPLDLFAALDGLPYTFAEINADDRAFLLTKAEQKNFSTDRHRSVLVECRESTGGGDIISCKRPSFGLTAYLELWEGRLARQGIPVNERTYFELMRRGAFGVSKGIRAETTDSFRQKLAERGIKFIKVSQSLIE